MTYSGIGFEAAESESTYMQTDWRFEMTQQNQTPEDLFEKAREAFFGTVKTSPKPSASPAGLLEPQDEPEPKEVKKER